jgi:predicted phosphoribosyltransferase
MGSAQWIKSSFNYKTLVIAVPVAPLEILDGLRHFADQVVVPFTPDSLIAIGRL